MPHLRRVPRQSRGLLWRRRRTAIRAPHHAASAAAAGSGTPDGALAGIDGLAESPLPNQQDHSRRCRRPQSASAPAVIRYADRHVATSGAFTLPSLLKSAVLYVGAATDQPMSVNAAASSTVNSFRVPVVIFGIHRRFLHGVRAQDAAHRVGRPVSRRRVVFQRRGAAVVRGRRGGARKSSLRKHDCAIPDWNQTPGRAPFRGGRRSKSRSTPSSSAACCG